jgi:type I restriction enzyme S subunit
MNLSAAYRIDEEEYQKRTRRERVIADDILYGREGERWGFAALAPLSPTVCLGQRMMQFRAAKHFCSGFLMWQLNARSTYEQGALDSTGSTSPHVNVDTIKNYLLTKPPFSEQTAIATYLDRETAKLDKLVEKIETAITRLQEYRTALITAAVTGKIDVRVVE